MRYEFPFTRGYFGDLLLVVLGAALAAVLEATLAGREVGAGPVVPVTTLFGLCGAIVLLINGTNRSVWRWTTGDDVLRIVRGGLLTGLLFVLVEPAVLGATPDFASTVLMQVFAVGGMIAARGMARLLDGGGLPALFRVVSKNAPATIMVGATTTVTRTIHYLRARGPLPFKPIAIVSTQGNQIGRVFAGARVHDGRTELDLRLADLTDQALLRHPQVRIALIGQDPGRRAVRAALDVVATRNAKLLRMPEVPDAPMAPVAPADVLGRPPRRLDRSGPERLLKNKRVLVTGAGGTIGSELVRQIAGFQPGQLLLLDMSETNLHAIALEVAEVAPGLQFCTRLADVRDEGRMDALFREFQPQVIIHAAANKHVPLMEMHPCEAIRVNLGGTRTLANAAMRVGCEVFVLISTDKAVNPANVMGAAKRAAELYMRACWEEMGGRFISVRFGNVLGSSGSIMPLFERQIERGGPVTVTDPEMTRWFMTVEEAGALVLQAAALGVGAVASRDPGGPAGPATNLPGGSLYVLDMGEPMKILDLAEGMIRMKGKEPHRDIEIRIVGTRPGEKRTEELFYPEETHVSAPVEGVYAVTDEAPLHPQIHQRIGSILEAADRDNTDDALRELAQLVPQFHSPMIGR